MSKEEFESYLKCGRLEYGVYAPRSGRSPEGGMCADVPAREPGGPGPGTSDGFQMSAAGRSAAGVRQVAHHGHAHLEAVAVVVRQAATDTRKRAVVQIKPIRAERRI